ncbi:MAG TPA: acylphosphatase [Syntrophales bacterium]|nr:acylphosphatase [Syntrophales bacterium]
MKRIHVTITGRVQGVAFRAKTRSEAIRNNVSGWVRNLPDGGVEAVFEGKPEEVDRVVSWCRVGPSLAVVEHVEVLEEPYTGTFKEFSIRYGP